MYLSISIELASQYISVWRGDYEESYRACYYGYEEGND